MPQYALVPREAVPADVVGGTACRRRVYAALFRVDRPLVSRDAVCGEGYHILEKSALGSAGVTGI